LASVVEFSDDDLALLQADLQRVDLHAALQRVGERAMGLDAFVGGDGTPGWSDDADWLRAATFAMTRDDDLALYLDVFRRYYAAAGKPWPQAIREAAAIADELEARTNSAEGRLRYGVTAWVMPELEFTFESAPMIAAYAVVGETALAVAQFRRTHGAPPEKLEQLVPEFLAAVPTDPFDEQPLRYYRDESGYTVYSVGLDGKETAASKTPIAASRTWRCTFLSARSDPVAVCRLSELPLQVQEGACHGDVRAAVLAHRPAKVSRKGAKAQRDEAHENEIGAM
jgi:hypothetical protein